MYREGVSHSFFEACSTGVGPHPALQDSSLNIPCPRRLKKQRHVDGRAIQDWLPERELVLFVTMRRTQRSNWEAEIPASLDCRAKACEIYLRKKQTDRGLERLGFRLFNLLLFSTRARYDEEDFVRHGHWKAHVSASWARDLHHG